MSGAFTGAERGLAGYYDYRDRRLTAQERDEDRERDLGLRDKLDPIKLRRAELLLNELERNEDLQMYLEAARHKYKAADRANTAGERADRAGERAETADIVAKDEFISGRGIREDTRQRGNRIGQMQEELATRQQPGLLQDIKDKETLRPGNLALNMSRNDYQQGVYDSNAQQQDMWGAYYELESQFKNALAVAEQMQDPAAIISAYDNLIPDGQEVQIQVSPPTPQNRGGKVNVITPRTVAQFGPRGVEYDNFQDFLKDTQKVFQNYLQQIQPSIGMGLTQPGGRGAGMPGMPGMRSGYGSQRGTGLPAEITSNRYFENALRDSPLSEGMTDGEIILMAKQFRDDAASFNPEQAALSAYMSIVEKLISRDRFGRQTPESIQAQAAEFVDGVFGGVNWRRHATAGNENGITEFNWRDQIGR